MGSVLAQITIPHDSNVPRDAISNAWHFWVAGDPETADGPTAGELFKNWVAARLHDFYDKTGVTRVGSMISAAYNPAAATLKQYDLGDPIPRVPYDTRAIDCGPGSGAAPLPEEVALCMSYRSAVASGEVAARRRGRLYFGPLTTSTLNLDVGNVIPDASLVNALTAGGADLIAAGSDQAYWAVYSTVDNVSRAVTDGWVDNAYDTQRRRGRAASTRTTFT